MKKVTVGLFGTCGNTTFRKDLFIPVLEKIQADIFNPQLGPGEWDPSCAAIEAEHLATDDIILLPITKDTFGLASLAEIGFTIAHAIKDRGQRDFIIMIDQELSPDLLMNEQLAKESLKIRALVKEHAKEVDAKNVFIVDSLSSMIELASIRHSIKAYDMV